MRYLLKRFGRKLGQADKDQSKVRRANDTWFDSHYNFAAERVLEWLKTGLDFDAEPSPALLDFGCGGAITTLGVAMRCPRSRVTGVDIGDRFLQLPALAGQQLGVSSLPSNLELKQIRPRQPLAEVCEADAVFSWSVFEHIPAKDIPPILRDIHGLLPAQGLLFIQIEPLFYSPWGSHLRRFIDTPWAHLIWPEERLREAVMAYEGEIPLQHQGHRYREMGPEAFKRFHLEEYEKLNRCTADDIRGYVEEAGFEIVRDQRMKFDMKIPDELLHRYDEEILLNNGMLLLGRKVL